jgi:hypothetical protein
MSQIGESSHAITFPQKRIHDSATAPEPFRQLLTMISPVVEAALDQKEKGGQFRRLRQEQICSQLERFNG